MAKQYLHQGSLVSCLDVMGAMFKQRPDDMLSLLKNDRSKYYSLVDDDFLENNEPNPNDGTQRVLLRLSMNEYIITVSWLHNRQGKLDLNIDVSQNLETGQ